MITHISEVSAPTYEFLDTEDHFILFIYLFLGGCVTNHHSLLPLAVKPNLLALPTSKGAYLSLICHDLRVLKIWSRTLVLQERSNFKFLSQHAHLWAVFEVFLMVLKTSSDQQSNGLSHPNQQSHGVNSLSLVH